MMLKKVSEMSNEEVLGLAGKLSPRWPSVRRVDEIRAQLQWEEDHGGIRPRGELVAS